MSQHESSYATTSAMAGLASELEQLRRRTDPLADLPTRVAELGNLLDQLAGQVAELSSSPAADPVPSWMAAPHDAEHVRQVLDELIDWVESVFLRYTDAQTVVPECWAWHPDVVEELLWLRHAWHAAYHGPKASVTAVGDWHDRYRPGVVRRLKHTASCSLEQHTPPQPTARLPLTEAAEPISHWWGLPARPGPTGADRRAVHRRRSASPRGRWAPMSTRTHALWLPGLLVALGAAIATAHGLYEVARAAACPPLIAALYPLITDGLALVAYAATTRLAGSARRYAWTVVVLAAGLSGLAQASYLAQTVATAPPMLRFGIGAWPALAAATVAHLLYLIATASTTGDGSEPATAASSVAVRPVGPSDGNHEKASVQQPEHGRPEASTAVQRDAVQSDAFNSVQLEPVHLDTAPSSATVLPAVQPSAETGRAGQSSARVRAEQAARSFLGQHNAWPTVRDLADLAEVSRGTAGAALKALRSESTRLHLVHDPDQNQDQP